MESDRELLEMFPCRPPKLLLRWNDARAQVARAGAAFVTAGRVRGSKDDIALAAAERVEAYLCRQLFGF